MSHDIIYLVKEECYITQRETGGIGVAITELGTALSDNDTQLYMTIQLFHVELK